MKLYELTGEYALLRERVLDGDELASDELAAISDALEQKSLAIVRIVRELELDVSALDDEIERLQERKKRALANREKLRSYVLTCMELAGVEKLKASTFTLALRDCPASVDVVDESAIPPEFIRTKREVNKSEILRVYKQDGEIPPGVRIERARRLEIR